MVEPLHPHPNYRSPSYSIASTDTQCWHCSRWTRVLALLLPEDHELPDPESAEDLHVWQPAGANAFVFYVAHLPDGVQARLSPLSATFRAAQSESTGDRYWANHCEHCGSLLDDHELHCEIDGAFMPCSEEKAKSIRLLRINEPFEGMAAGYAPEPEFLRFMRKG